VEKKQTDGDGLLSMIVVSCYKPFKIIIFGRMALLIDIWQVLLDNFVACDGTDW
jgi:hypothetical protein